MDEQQAATHHEGGLIVRRVHLACQNPSEARQLYDVHCLQGRVSGVWPHDQNRAHLSKPLQLDAGGRGLLLPSLCHSHIHLDKCFLLDMCDELVTGDFGEALKVTSKAKSHFASAQDDLYSRGRRLVRESVECGVTCMRAHVEVDRTVNLACLDVGLRLKEQYKAVCDVQLAVFAQDPLYLPDDPHPSDNLTLLRLAASRDGISAIGSAPYVEPSVSHSKLNINHVLDIAEEHNLHVDFHLDYNVDPASEPLVYYVISELRARGWGERVKGGLSGHVTIGHATRLSLLSPEQWRDLVHSMGDLPISFVGLPQSDLYMMGREEKTPPGLGPHRGTLRVPQLKKEYGLDIGLSVNNVENAFTPQGSVDPLALCPLGVATYQAGTPTDCRILLEAVSLVSRRAIGQIDVPTELVPVEGDPGDFVLLHANSSLQSAALNPCWERTTIKGGVVVSRRTTNTWVLNQELD